VVALAAGCAAGHSGAGLLPSATSLAHSAAASPRAAASPGAAASSSTAASASAGRAPGTARPLDHAVIGIDPGHNGRNGTDPSYLNHQVWNGRTEEACDTTGTETNAGYPEARFTWRVASFLRRDLRREGATVALTRHNDHGIGPCVNTRAKILNRAHAAVAIDIHGDGGPASGRGFAILEPVADGPNNHIIHPSTVFGRIVRHAMLAHTSMPTSSYDGSRGLTHRSDLAGLNLATEPKVLIECGNMRNATDARLMTSTHFQRQVAKALTRAIVYFVKHH
jgi:N-acetylmuramoyl-L-alanine amidase